MKKLIILSLLLLLSDFALATKTKEIKKTFAVEKGKKIELNTTGGMNVNVKAWDKDSIYFNLRLKVESSDDEYEQEYLDAYDIEKWETSSDMVIDFVETDSESGWSFWDIFSGKFHYNFSRDIRGEIFLPKTSPAELHIRYSKINLTDNTSKIDIIGRGNDIILTNCSNVNRIENAYGNIDVKNSTGDLDIDGRGSNIFIDEFTGNVKIDALYAEIDVNRITGDVDIETRSAETKIKHIDGNLKLSSDYSKVNIEDVRGIIIADHRSEEFTVKKAGGIIFDGPYTELKIEDIDGTAGKEIKIRNKSGKIWLKNAVGNVMIDDSYSAIWMINVEGNVNLKHRSAPINIDMLKGNLVSESQYSSYTLHNIESDSIAIGNRSEGIVLNLKNYPKFVDISNSYGEVEMSIGKDYKGELYLESAYGQIKCALPLSINTLNGNTTVVKGKIGNANSKISIKNRSDDIIVRTE